MKWWFKKNKADKKRSSELVKLATETTKASEEFLKVVDNPNSTPEEIQLAIKAAKQASEQADKKLDDINKIT